MCAGGLAFVCLAQYGFYGYSRGDEGGGLFALETGVPIFPRSFVMFFFFMLLMSSLRPQPPPPLATSLVASGGGRV